MGVWGWIKRNLIKTVLRLEIDVAEERPVGIGRTTRARMASILGPLPIVSLAHVRLFYWCLKRAVVPFFCIPST